MMQKFALMILSLCLIGTALVGCGGGVSEATATKVLDAWIAECVKDAEANKKAADVTEIGNKVAKANGFKDWADFVQQGTKALGEKFSKLVSDKTAENGTKQTEAITKAVSGGAANDNKPK